MSDFTPHPDKAVLNQWPVSSWAWPRIVVFVPLTAALGNSYSVFPRFWAIAQQGVPFLPIQPDVTHVARCRAGEALLKTDFTHILMLDQDHIHDAYIVQKMARWVIENPERMVVAGLYFNRREPYEPLAWAKDERGRMCRIMDWTPGIIDNIEMCGTGCMLINREVFEKIKRPWFWYDHAGIEEAKADFVYPTEDIWFCNRVREAGMMISLDTTIKMPHARTEWVDETSYRDYAVAHAVEDRKVEAIAKLLDVASDTLEEMARRGGLSVKEAWEKARPQMLEEVEAFYGSKDSGYFTDLINWNRSPLYQKIIKPLKDVSDKSVLVIGPGIGGEIDALLGMGNKIAAWELPGALRKFLISFYKDEVDFQGTKTAPFDLVVAIDVIEHVHPDALSDFLDSITDVIKPGGKLYCHNNFAQQDLYPMHYAENEAVFEAWAADNFIQEGKGIYAAL